MERPNIPPDSKERAFLSSANYVFTAVFAVEMLIKVNEPRFEFNRPRIYRNNHSGLTKFYERSFVCLSNHFDTALKVH